MAEKQAVKINVNEWVKVKLTDVGKDIFYHQHDDLNEVLERRGVRPLERQMPTVDEDGYTSFQLWGLIELYGPYMHMGGQIPFELDIVYEGVKGKE